MEGQVEGDIDELLQMDGQIEEEIYIGEIEGATEEEIDEKIGE